MIKKLNLASDLAIPPEVVGETIAILATRGAGKSNTAAVLAEQMFKAGIPFNVIDPVGAWYGLRSNAEGTGPGLPIPIFGGKRGDVPLERTGGALIADLVVDQRLTCILDLSGFESEAAKKQFLLDYARRLYLRNEEPLHLFLEEADDYIPQKVIGGGEKLVETQLLRAFENIVRRGRSRGLGMTMITQRSAVLNKNVLTQAGTLIAMRTAGPQDRDAVAAWLKYHGQAEEILASLDSLAPGEAWIYSPQFMKITKRVQFFRRSTFDSGATPKLVKGVRPVATLANVDLEGIAGKMAATIEKAKADDPKALRAELLRVRKESDAAISALHRELTAAQSAATKAERPDLEEALAAEKRNAVILGELIEELQAEAAALRMLIEENVANAQKIIAAGELTKHIAEARPAPEPVKVTPPAPKTEKPKNVTRDSIGNFIFKEPAPPPDSRLSIPQQTILNVLASFEALDVRSVDRSTLALFADVSPRASGYANNLGRLRTLGLVDYPGSGLVALTDDGRAIAEKVEAPLTLAAYHEAWFSRISGPQRRMLNVLIGRYPAPIDRDELANMTDQSPKASGFANSLGFLRNSLGLIEYPAAKQVAASDRLFPAGLR